MKTMWYIGVSYIWLVVVLMYNTNFDTYFCLAKNSLFTGYGIAGPCTTKHWIHAVTLSHKRCQHFNTSSEQASNRGLAIGYEFLAFLPVQGPTDATSGGKALWAIISLNEHWMIATIRMQLIHKSHHSPRYTVAALYMCTVPIGRTACCFVQTRNSEMQLTITQFQKIAISQRCSVILTGRPCFIISNMILAAFVGNTKSWEVNMKNRCQKN